MAGNQVLRQKSEFFNPFFLSVNDREYELKDIVIYKPDSSSIHTGHGWFGSSNGMSAGLVIPEVIRRSKPKYDGQTFIIPQKRERFDRKDESKGILYIPYEYFDFEIKVVDHHWGNGRVESVQAHVSKKFRMDAKTPLTVEDNTSSVSVVSEEACTLSAEIVVMEAELNAQAERIAVKRKELREM